MANFDEAYRHLAQVEGGWTERPNETAFGIDRKANPHWRGWAAVDQVRRMMPPNLRKKTLRERMTAVLRSDPQFMASVKAFFRSNYWVVNYERILDQALANYVFDKAVVCGPVQAHKIVQRALKIKDDGLCGSQTIAALNANDPILTREKIDAFFDAFFSRLADANPEMEQYEQGWLHR